VGHRPRAPERALTPRGAEAHGNDYALALSWTVGLVGVLVALVVLLGGEKKSLEMRGPS
jgi:hypothetical protein